METFLGCLVAILLLIVYFVPTAIAVGNGHSNALPIFVLNLFLGWTIIGWVGALVWALCE